MLPKDTGEIIFAGNSITKGFPLSEMIGSLKVKNRGIEGNKSADLLNRLSELAEPIPQKIFLEIGINDIKYRDEKGDSLSNSKIFSNIRAIFIGIKQLSPKTKINFLSILPTSKEYKMLNKRAVDLNSFLKSYCDKNAINFVDLSPVFTKNNELRNIRMMDFI